MQDFEQKNQEKILGLHKLQVEKRKEKAELESKRKTNSFSKFFLQHGHKIALATGTITLFASYAITQKPVEMCLLSAGVFEIMEVVYSGASYFHKDEVEISKQVEVLKQLIADARAEADLRYQVSIYLCYGIILASIGYYQDCLEKEWFQIDEELRFVVQRMISQLEQDERLERQDPIQYENLLLEREAVLEGIFKQNPEKIYLLSHPFQSVS